MKHSDWTDEDWKRLVHEARIAIGGGYSDKEIREIAFSYMRNGTDEGGNADGLVGTYIARCVDRITAGERFFS